MDRLLTVGEGVGHVAIGEQGTRTNRTIVLARPTGVKPTRAHSGLKSIPIEGAVDWEVATMSSA
jgi:hypothetical protein